MRGVFIGKPYSLLLSEDGDMAYQRRYKVPVDMAIEQADMFSNKAGEIVADVKSRGQEALDGMKKAVARKTPAGSTSD